MQHSSKRTSRRKFLHGTGGGLFALSWAGPGRAEQEGRTTTKKPSARSAGKQSRKGQTPVKVISSENGLQAAQRVLAALQEGQDTLDAAIAGVTLVEDDPNDNTVGYGGLPNEDGIVELDAAVMHGPTHRAGAVAALQRIKNPAQVARLVMEQTDHQLLVGEGALRFAKAMGFAEQELLTEKSRKLWLYWRQTRGDGDDWLPPPDDLLDPEVARYFRRPTGTIHMAAINAAGEISCVTSTSGLAFKIAGRVGDSPIVGAGLYVDNDVGSCGSTGRGEANLANLTSVAGVELMRSGLAPADAGLAVLRRVAEKTVDRLRDEQGRPDFDLKFYLLAKDGRHAGVSMWGPARFVIADRTGTRHEDCVSLYDRPS